MDLSSDDEFDDLPRVSSLSVTERNQRQPQVAPGDAPGDSGAPCDGAEDRYGDDSGDDGDAVAAHYNARPESGQLARSRSAILHLRLFNNWIKSVLIREFVRGRALKVLDLACGKGGDLGKWNRLSVTHLTGVDIAAVSVTHAQERYRELSPRFEGRFIVLDAFHKPFGPGVLPLRRYDTVSCQFAFQYAFESLAAARTAIANVAQVLAPGGYFFGTVPNADEIINRLSTESKDHCTIEAKHYRIVFDEPVDMQCRSRNPFGMRYTFYLVDAIDGCPEYLIPMPVFRAMCEEAGLGFVQELSFPRFYEHYSQMGEYENLLRRMGVIDPLDGQIVLNDDERAVASLYTTFVFRKKTPL